MNLKEAQEKAIKEETVYYDGTPYRVSAVGVRYKKHPSTGKIAKIEYIELLDRNGQTTVSVRPQDVKETFNDAETSTE